jgi:hypothetical protein
MDQQETRAEQHLNHPTLGRLTEEEFRYLRLVPIGYGKAEFTLERLQKIRQHLARRRPKL